MSRKYHFTVKKLQFNNLDVLFIFIRFSHSSIIFLYSCQFTLLTKYLFFFICNGYILYERYNFYIETFALIIKVMPEYS